MGVGLRRALSMCVCETLLSPFTNDTASHSALFFAVPSAGASGRCAAKTRAAKRPVSR
jgi:hypothetical protein